VIPALLYLFRRIEARLDGSPAFLVLDEAWSYLQHPIFQRKLANWLRTMRKRNACVILSTQQIGDISSSAIADVILDNCPTRFLLPNAEAANPVSADFYRRAGLNAQEIAMLARSHLKKHYYLVTRTGRRLIVLDCGRVLLSVVGVEGAVERRALRELIERGGANWRAGLGGSDPWA
jgi:type IV secretion system protein VirB4